MDLSVDEKEGEATKRVYDIEKVLAICSESDGKPLMQFIAKTLNELNSDLLCDLYKELGKDYMVGMLEKTLRVENEGGMLKKRNAKERSTNEKRTAGGVFFHLLRSNEKSNLIIKSIFKANYKAQRLNYKTMKKLSNISI